MTARSRLLHPADFAADATLVARALIGATLRVDGVGGRVGPMRQWLVSGESSCAS